MRDFPCFAVFDLNPGEVGLSLTYAISLLTIFQWGVRQSTEIENWVSACDVLLDGVTVNSNGYSEYHPERQLFYHAKQSHVLLMKANGL